jgi:hypothetical protein
MRTCLDAPQVWQHAQRLLRATAHGGQVVQAGLKLGQERLQGSQTRIAVSTVPA